jgi:hypothetical protein
MRAPASRKIHLPRLRGRIEEGEAGVLHGALVAAASPTLPFPASGGGNLGEVA